MDKGVFGGLILIESSNSTGALPVQPWKWPKEAKQGWHFKWIWREADWAHPRNNEKEGAWAELGGQAENPQGRVSWKAVLTLWTHLYVWHRLGTVDDPLRDRGHTGHWLCTELRDYHPELIFSESPTSGERELPKSTLYSFLPSHLHFLEQESWGWATRLIPHIVASSSYRVLPVTYVPQVISSWGLERLHLFPHSFRQCVFIAHLLCARPHTGNRG